MGCHPSHWRTHIFQDGYCATKQIMMIHGCGSKSQSRDSPWPMAGIVVPHFWWDQRMDSCHMRCQWFGSQGCQCEQFSRVLTSLVRSWWLRGAKNPQKGNATPVIDHGTFSCLPNFNLKGQNHPTLMGRRSALVGHEHHVGNSMLDFRGDVHPRQQEKRSHHPCYFWVQSKWTKWESCDISYIPTVKGVSTIVLYSYAIVYTIFYAIVYTFNYSIVCTIIDVYIYI